MLCNGTGVCFGQCRAVVSLLSGAREALAVESRRVSFYINVVQHPGRREKEPVATMSSGSSQVDVKYDFTPHDGTPGKPFDQFEKRLVNFAASVTDDRGFSLADHLLGTDEGGPLNPAMPVGAGAAKAATARRSRQKKSYALLTKHELDEDHVNHMSRHHFQDGHAAMRYLRGACQEAVDALKLRDLNKEWDDIDLLIDIGVHENSIKFLVKHIRSKNAERPLLHQKSLTDMTEKLLECIFATSKHFSEGATIEYKAMAGNRQFEIAVGLPNAGQRDLQACELHYHSLWKSAVENRLPGFQKRQPSTRPTAPTRNTLEGGLSAFDAAAGSAGREAHPRVRLPRVHL